MTPARHFINISGGKDSAAVALLAADSGRPFELWMADTGNEHESTVEYAHYLADFFGKPLNIARYDFSEKIARKREYVETVWRKEGVAESIIQAALAVLHPTGNPFVDLCIWKGRFPSRRAQFCTEWLKANAIEQHVAAALNDAPLVQWLGVRRDESLNRKDVPMWQTVRRKDTRFDLRFYRPIIHWTAQNVFAFAKSRSLKPNPLYLQGFGRVGCFPCINSDKAGLGEIGRRYPEVIERLMEWEKIVGTASKRGQATFFASDSTPEGAAIALRLKRQARAFVKKTRPDLHPEDNADAFDKAARKVFSKLSATAPWPKADRVFDWAKTTRGGRQFDLLQWAMDGEDSLSCSSQYGLCE